MKYMLLIYSSEDQGTQEQREACMIESAKICAELASQGKLLQAEPLRSVTTATCVRIRDGKKQVIDGPFAETAEQLGGYYILDVDNLDEAIAIAASLPPVSKGTVEIRPIEPLPSQAQSFNTQEVSQR